MFSDTPGRIEDGGIWRNCSSGVLSIHVSIHVMWDPLPTLDLTGIDPDIVYTVELVKIICGQKVSVSRRVVAGSNMTEENLDLMQIYKAVIAARNNVQGAMNGPSMEIIICIFSVNFLIGCYSFYDAIHYFTQ